MKDKTILEIKQYTRQAQDLITEIIAHYESQVPMIVESIDLIEKDDKLKAYFNSTFCTSRNTYIKTK